MESTSFEPLVSVPVITYNSSQYVIETLESIKNQTYRNLELIVSDDCSTDDTVKVCREWIEKNKDRFVRTVLLESPVNTGVSANGNRAANACRGEWVKGIAGDDLLMPNCIESFVEYVNDNQDAVVVFSKMKVFGEDESRRAYIEKAFDERNDRMNQMPLDEQKQLIITGCTPPAPAFFYNRESLINLGIKNDERIKMIEDWPKWLNLLNKGIRLQFLDKSLVMYRLGGISTSRVWESLPVFKAKRQVALYYLFTEQYSKEPQTALDTILEFECSQYQKIIQLHQQNEIFKRNICFRIFGKFRKIFEK